MDITPFRVGTIIGTKGGVGVYKIKRVGIYEEQRNSDLYSVSSDFYIDLLLTPCYISGFIAWELPRTFENFEVESNVYSIFSIQHNLDNNIEIQLRVLKKL